MKNLLKGMGYLTWLICNISLLYGVGIWVKKIIEAEDLAAFFFTLSLVMEILFLITILSMLVLGLMAVMFKDEEMEDKVKSWLKIN